MDQISKYDLRDDNCHCDRYKREPGFKQSDIVPKDKDRCCARCLGGSHKRCCRPRLVISFTDIYGNEKQQKLLWCKIHNPQCDQTLNEEMKYAKNITAIEKGPECRDKGS